MICNVKKNKCCFSVKPILNFMPGVVVFIFFLALSSGSLWADTADLDYSGTTDFNDFSILASYWMSTDCGEPLHCEGADFEPDGDVDATDLLEFCSQWLNVEATTHIELEKTLYSIGDQDGRIWDNGLGTGTPGAKSDDLEEEWEIRLGDVGAYDTTMGYRSVMAFDMTELQSDAQITSARLELVRSPTSIPDNIIDGMRGKNPFTWGGECRVDVNVPYFGAASALAVDDWVASANAVSTATMSVNGLDPNFVESTDFDANGLNAFDVNGTAQIRVSFENTTNDTNDANDDWMSFYSGDYISDDSKRPKLIVTYLTTRTPTVELDSIAVDDGRVWAEQNVTWQGTGVNNTDDDNAALRIGDFSDDYSLRFVLSFDTSSLPDDCTILSAKLKLTRGYADFALDPFVWGGGCHIDVNSPAIGDTNSLEASDWEAVSSASQVAQILADPGEDLPVESTDFGAAGLNAISKTAKTQLKVYLTEENYSNTNTTDVVCFYSGDYSVADWRPKLIIKYRINTP